MKPVFMGRRRCVNWNLSTSRVTRRRAPTGVEPPPLNLLSCCFPIDS